ncbi:MAG: S8 family serine peptidase [Burkholderiales bacterium]
MSAKLVQWPANISSCSADVTLGLVDTGIDAAHPSLRGRNIEVLTLRGKSRPPSGKGHGTAIASILVGAAGSSSPGLLPGARVVAVDAFHRATLGDDRMDAFDLVAAIDALLDRGVRIINFSFSGPPNELLETAIKTAQARGVLMVAAVGNEGPKAPPRYPAAYGEVIAVTAIDARFDVYRRANRGQHVDLAAPGVDVWAADVSPRVVARAQSGTSYATPFVTAVLALIVGRSPDVSADAAKASLLGAVRDLGTAGHDPVFGHGLIQAAKLCAQWKAASG